MNQYNRFLKPKQKSPLPGMNMVKNNAGGYSFQISDIERLDRFLLLGSDGGTYYVSEQALTQKCATFVIDFIKRDSKAVFDRIRLFSEKGRAIKYNTILFVFALVLAYGDEPTKKLGYKYIAELCFTPTQLFQLLKYLKPIKGWSRGLRNGVANWYLSRENDKLAYQIVKYRQRSGYDHKDVFRLCHVKCNDEKKHAILQYAFGKPNTTDNKLIASYELVNSLTKENPINENKIIEAITDGRLTWEMIPTDLLNNTAILSSLIPEMPPTALMRNLNRLAYNDMTEFNNNLVQLICDKLRDIESLKINKVHPINVVNSMKTYASGKGEKGKKTWSPNQHILDALNDTYELSMATLTPTKKSIVVGVDVSGSMSSSCSNTSLSCSQVGYVLAHALLNSEPYVDLIGFDTNCMKLPIGKRSSLDEVLKLGTPGGGTDCSIPLKYTLQYKHDADVIIIFTDSETWSGDVHAFTVYKEIKKRNPNLKVIEVALSSEPYSSFPPEEKNILRIVGFDASIVTLIQRFIES